MALISRLSRRNFLGDSRACRVLQVVQRSSQEMARNHLFLSVYRWPFRRVEAYQTNACWHTQGRREKAAETSERWSYCGNSESIGIRRQEGIKVYVQGDEQMKRLARKLDTGQVYHTSQYKSYYSDAIHLHNIHLGALRWKNISRTSLYSSKKTPLAQNARTHTLFCVNTVCWPDTMHYDVLLLPP